MKNVPLCHLNPHIKGVSLKLNVYIRGLDCHRATEHKISRKSRGRLSVLADFAPKNYFFVKYSCMALAAFFPASMALITVASPVTISPPA